MTASSTFWAACRQSPKEEPRRSFNKNMKSACFLLKETQSWTAGLLSRSDDNWRKKKRKTHGVVSQAVAAEFGSRSPTNRGSLPYLRRRKRQHRSRTFTPQGLLHGLQPRWEVLPGGMQLAPRSNGLQPVLEPVPHHDGPDAYREASPSPSPSPSPSSSPRPSPSPRTHTRTASAGANLDARRLGLRQLRGLGLPSKFQVRRKQMSPG
jgi:hypothetical protein